MFKKGSEATVRWEAKTMGNLNENQIIVSVMCWNEILHLNQIIMHSF
jgi:hypothetical protein